MQFAHFEFDPAVNRIGEGPQSEVFRAVDTELGRTVALKILRPNVDVDPASTQRFEREARHTSALVHPNIATVYEFGRYQGTSYIAMEYLEGRTLDKVLRNGPLTYEECVRIGLQVSAALALAHSKGFVHRDLKPANVMLEQNGRVKLLDFGISRARDEATITQSGMLVGTVLYMSPEQVRGDEIDVRSDIFAFGSVLYHAATGALPFPGKSFPEVCIAIVEGPLKRPSEVRPGMPRQLEQYLLRCLTRDPEGRFQNGAAAHGALLAVADAMRLSTGVDTAASLRGRLFVPPFEVTSPRDGARLFAAGVRRDLHSELSRSTGLEIALLEGDELPADAADAYYMRGRLDWTDSVGRVDYSFFRLDRNGETRATELWQDRIEHSDADEWGLQAQLVGALVRSVRRKLLEHAYRPPAEAPRAPAKARALVMDAHETLHRGAAINVVAALAKFRRAIEADPEYALAHAGYAEALVRKFLSFDGDRKAVEEAMEHARRALVIDPQCAEGHTSLGFALSMTGRQADAQREYRIAIQIDNREWLAHRLLGALYEREGNYKGAAPLLRRAIGLQAFHIGSYDHLFCVLSHMDRYEEALEIADRGIAKAREWLATRKDDQDARVHLALLLARLGSADEAKSEIEMARAVAPRDGFTAYHIACVWSVLREVAPALEALKEAQARGYYLRSELGRNSDLDALRGEADFQALLA